MVQDASRIHGHGRSVTPLREAAAVAAEALTDAVEHHVTAVRKAVREAEDAPKLDPLVIEPEIAGDPPEPMFHSLDDFVTATRKPIARRDGSEGGSAHDDREADGGDAA